MIYSEAVWMTETDDDKALTKLSTETKKFDAVKEQLRIWNQGAGWKDEHHVRNLSFASMYRNNRAVHACPQPQFSSMETLPEIGDTL